MEGPSQGHGEIWDRTNEEEVGDIDHYGVFVPLSSSSPSRVFFGFTPSKSRGLDGERDSEGEKVFIVLSGVTSPVLHPSGERE